MKVLKVLVVLALMGMSAGLAVLLATRPVVRVVHSWPSPDQELTLAVVQSDWDYRGLPFTIRPRYAVYIGRDPVPSYGLYVDYGVTERFAATMDEDIARSEVSWSDQGVTLKAPAGQVLFVPKRCYGGGR